MMKFRESGHQVFRVTSPLSRRTLKRKRGGKLLIHFYADGDMNETVFRTIVSVHQFSICGATSDLCEEYKSCHVRIGRLVLVRQIWPLFAPASWLTMTPTPSVDVLTQEDPLHKYQERVDKLSQRSRVIKICTDGFLTTLKSDSISWRKTMGNKFMERLVVNTLFQEVTDHHNQKDGSKGTPKLGPCWKSQSVICCVSTEWKSESCPWTRTILTLGSEFLMNQTSWSRTWATTKRTTPTNRNLWKKKVENECTCFFEPIKGQSKTTKTFFCQHICKNCIHQGKNMDWYWARRCLTHRSPSIKTAEHSSSSWSSSWRRRWSDWILEIKGVSSERFQSQHWSDEKLKSIMAKDGGNKKETNIVLICTEYTSKWR